MADGFRLRVFGPPALVDGGGRAVYFRTKKQLALLVFLHFEARNHPVAREGLVELLWPEVNPDKGRHSLSQALSVVRARLGERAVNTRTETVGLVAPLLTELDLLGAGTDEVADLADPLRDLDKCAGADFAHWVDSARERLHSAARERLAAGLREARSRGDLAGVARLAALLHRGHRAAERHRYGGVVILRPAARPEVTVARCTTSSVRRKACGARVRCLRPPRRRLITVVLR